MSRPSNSRCLFPQLVVVAFAAVFPQLALTAEPESIPIQRVELPPDRLAAEMERVKRHTLTQLSRATFEELLQKAGNAEAASKNPPRLTAARYQATLQGDALVGTAEWVITHRSDRPGRLPLGSLQFALRHARWSDQSPVILGLLDDRPDAGHELLVERSGERTLVAEWSLRGVKVPGECDFELRLPWCVGSSFELDLPPDAVVQADSDDVLIGGPIAYPSPLKREDLRRWRIVFARPSPTGIQARLSIHRTPAVEQPKPLLRTTQQTTLKLSPGKVECEFVVDAQVVRGSMQSLAIECAPGLRVVDLAAPGLEEWTAHETADGPIRIELRLRDAFRAGRLLLRAVAHLPLPGLIWNCPWVKVQNALTRGERIVLHVHPGLRLEDWKTGGFRPATPAEELGQEQVIALQSRDWSADAGARPQAFVRPADEQLRIREQWEWRIEPNTMQLSAEFQVQSTSGSTRDLSWQVPAGWEVDRVEARPTDSGLRWKVVAASANSPALLTIESGRSDFASPPIGRRLIVRLRALTPRLTPQTAARISIPDLRPTIRAAREGTISFRLDSSIVLDDARPAGPIDFRGSPEGAIALRMRRVRTEVHAYSSATVGAGRLLANYRLQVSPGAGQSLRISTSAPVRIIGWRTTRGAAQIRSLEAAALPSPNLNLVGSTSIWEVVARLSGANIGFQAWQMHFDRAILESTVVELTAEPIAVGDAASIPLLVASGVDRFVGRAIVRMPQGEARNIVASGLTEEPAAESDGWVERSFQFGSEAVQLSLRRSSPDSSPAVPSLAQGLIIIQPLDSGQTLYRFSAAIVGWHQQSLPIRLPPEAQLSAIRINGALSPHGARRAADQDEWSVEWNLSRASNLLELQYTTSDAAFGSINRVRLIEPRFPFPISIRRVWRLPSDSIPLWPIGWRRLPGGRAAWPTNAPVASEPPMSEPLRDHPARVNETLLNWLERLAFARAEGANAVVIDSIALAEVGLAPAVRSQMEFPSFGLQAVAWDRGLLITTPSRRTQWGNGMPADVLAAVERAAFTGQDRSGRFRALYHWSGTPEPTGLLPSSEPDASRFGDWEPIDDEMNREVWTASWWTPIVPGSAAALVLALCLWFIRRGRRWFQTITLVLLLLGYVWLPTYAWSLLLPASVVWLVSAGLVLFSRLASRSPVATTESTRTGAGVIVAMILSPIWFLAVPGTAAPPAATPVYLVSESKSVLAPPELLEALNRLVRAGEPTASAILLNSEYEGTVAGSTIRWDARFSVNCRHEVENWIALSLPEARLLSAEWDGQAILPLPGDDPNLHVFALQGGGTRTLRLTFVTSISGEADCETRFSIPESLTSSCTIHFPAGSSDILAVTARGLQEVAAEDVGVRLKADLGRTGVLQVRWRMNAAVKANRIPVQASHMWEIGESASRLISVFQFRLGSSVLRRLEFDVDSDLELVGISVRQVDAPFGLLGLTGVKDWRRALAGGRQRHYVEFQMPSSGRVQVELELIPIRPWNGRARLSMPEVVGEFERETAAGVRLQELAGSVADVRGWQGMEVEEFARDLWRPLRVDAIDRLPDFAFRRIPPAENALHLELRESGRNSGEQRLEWTVGPSRAELRALGYWFETPPSGPINWEIPPELIVTDVQGAGIDHWTRTGSHVQIWLDAKGGGKPNTISLFGSMPRAANNAMLFAVPVCRQLGLASSRTFLTVEPRDGLRIGVNELGPFRPMPDTELPGASWSGFAESPGSVSFLVSPAAGTIDGTSVTSVELSGRQMIATTTIDASIPSAGPGRAMQTMFVDVRHVDGERPQLSLPPDVRIRSSRYSSQGASWVIDARPGRHLLQVTSRSTWNTAQPLAVPAVTVRGVSDGARALRHQVIVGAGLQIHDSLGLQPGSIPGFLTRHIVHLLTVVRDSWELRLVAGSTNRVAVVTAEVTATAVESRSWLLRADFVLIADTASTWNVRWPADGAPVALRLNGRPFRWPTGEPMTVVARPHEVIRMQLTWRTQSPSDRPNWELPAVALGGAPVTPSYSSWSILTPPEFTIESGAEQSSRASSALRRAEARIEIIQQFATRWPSETRLALWADVLLDLRRAELALVGSGQSETTADGQPMLDVLRRLRAAAPPVARPAESPAAAPEDLAFDRGELHYWHMPNGGVPTIRLSRIESDRGRRVAQSVLAIVSAMVGAVVFARWRSRSA